ncbi:TPA: hypothetical protein JG914_004249 [Enterobacter hormaechei subsp. steigerwaltii]|nr:hypothetical protein [Enterobacter hormaechei subsp. steigerwaltii]
MNKIVCCIFTTSLILSTSTFANVVIKSKNGNSLEFSQSKSGGHYDPDSWGKLIFRKNGIALDLTRADRYYTEDGSTNVSPSGNFIVVNSVSGGEVDSGDGSKQYVDKAYCSVIDLRTGCVVSDWDGEACGYQWAKDKDQLVSSDDSDAENFDFLSMKPELNKVSESYSSLRNKEVENIMRCDAPDSENIDNYNKLAKQNINAKGLVQNGVVGYIKSLQESLSVVAKKTYLYSSSNENGKTKSYLVMGDKVKVVQYSSDKSWVKVGYISSTSKPLVAWLKVEDVK